MYKKDIYLYTSMDSWLAETPDAVLKGTVNSKSDGYIEVMDENGYTQIINISKLFAVVY